MGRGCSWLAVPERAQGGWAGRVQLHLLAFLDAILEKHIRLLPDKNSGESAASYIYYVKFRYRGLLRICCQSPGSSRASAGSFIATFSSGYRLRQEQTAARTHARTHARHRAVAGVSMSPFFFGLGGLQNGPGGTHRSISRAFWRGVPRKQPSRTIGRFIASRSAATCSSTGARVRAQKRRTELKSSESANRQS